MPKSDSHRSFVVALADRLRPLFEPATIVATTTRALGERLGATRVVYASIDEAREFATTGGDWTNGEAAHLPPRLRLADFGAALIEVLNDGETLVVDDVRRHRATQGSLPALDAIGVRALVSVPLVKDGRFVANLNVHDQGVRTWSADDVALIETIAERTWDVLERARAVRTLAERERELRTLTDALPVLISYIDADGRYRFNNRLYDDWFPGRDRDDIRGRRVRDVVGEEAYAAVERHVDDALAGRAVRFEQTMRYGGGDVRHVAAEYVPRRGADGGVEGFYALVQDISDRKAAETALRDSETRFRGVFDSGVTGFSLFDAITGETLAVNDRLLAMTGHSRADFDAGRWDWRALTPAEHRGADDAAIAQVRETGRWDAYEKEYRRRDGTRIPVRLSAAPLRGEPGRVVVAVQDLSAQRAAASALRDREEQLRLATDAADIGLWDVDLRNDTMFWPPRVKAMFGISADAPVSMDDFYAGLHPDDRAPVTAAFASACDPGRRAVYDVEYRTIGRDDGAVRWVAAKGRGVFEADGVCIRVIGTAIDITARKAAQADLRDLNEQLEQRVAERTAERNRVWEMSRDLLAIMGFDGRLRAINPAWETTLGRDRETLLAMPFPEQVHPGDHPAVAAVMARLARGEPVRGFEDRLRHADGSWRSISWSLVPEGDVFYAVGRDVTDEKIAAGELERAQEALRQSQKMEAMGQLTGGVAHDFNNLLTPIIGSLDLLERNGLGGERERRLIAGALQSAERAKTLVQRLLAFARRQPLQASAVDVARLVNGMADLIGSTSGPQINVVVEARDGLPPARADANQLEMALLNLGVNARDAMPDGGTLRITASAEQVGAGHPAKLAPGGYVRLSVADTGTGMDEATLARAIEPFFSTKGIGKGTGLGLSMVHGLASQLGGALTLRSRPGVGTNIELWLPASAEPPPPAPGSAATAPAPKVRGKVLLVDDEELVRMSTADMLSEMGYGVVEAASADEALRLVGNGFAPDLVVTDHLMPGMTGIELVARLREARPRLPVLIVSGYAESEGVSPDLPRLTKPFRNADLANSLAALADSRG